MHRERLRKKGFATENYARRANPGAEEQQRGFYKEGPSPPFFTTLTTIRTIIRPCYQFLLPGLRPIDTLFSIPGLYISTYCYICLILYRTRRALCIYISPRSVPHSSPRVYSPPATTSKNTQRQPPPKEPPRGTWDLRGQLNSGFSYANVEATLPFS